MHISRHNQNIRKNKNDFKDGEQSDYEIENELKILMRRGMSREEAIRVHQDQMVGIIHVYIKYWSKLISLFH